MWELLIHCDQDGQLILYNLVMIIFRFYYFSLREFRTADECYFSCLNRIEHYVWELPISLDQDGRYM